MLSQSQSQGQSQPASHEDHVLSQSQNQPASHEDPVLSQSPASHEDLALSQSPGRTLDGLWTALDGSGRLWAALSGAPPKCRFAATTCR